MPGWYGAGERVIEIASGTAVWRHGGMPVVPIRWVLVRDPAKRFEPQALLCTDLAREPAQVVSWFVRRWSGAHPAKAALFGGLSASSFSVI